MSVNPLCLELTTLPRGKSLAALRGNHGGYLRSCSESPPVGEAIPSHVSIMQPLPRARTPSSIPTRPAHSHLRDAHCSRHMHPTGAAHSTLPDAHTLPVLLDTCSHATWKSRPRPRPSSFLPQTHETRIPPQIPILPISCFRRC